MVRQVRGRPGRQQAAGSRLRVVGEQRLFELLPQRAARRIAVQELRPVLAELRLLRETPQPRLGRAMARMCRPFSIDLLRGVSLCVCCGCNTNWRARALRPPLIGAVSSNSGDAPSQRPSRYSITSFSTSST